MGPAADLWSAGCCLLEMLTGAPPWKGERHQVIARKVCDKRLGPPIPPYIDVETAALLQACFKYHPSSRPCATSFRIQLETIASSHFLREATKHGLPLKPQAESRRMPDCVESAKRNDALTAAIRERETWLLEHFGKGAPGPPARQSLKASQTSCSSTCSASSPGDGDLLIQPLLELGFDRADCEMAIVQAEGDVRRAASLLCERSSS